MHLSAENISLILKQDRKAQYELYKECFGYMMSISLRYQNDKQSAEDVVNRAFLKLLKSISSYDPSKSFKPWMSRITVNENIDACRKEQRLRGVIHFDSESVDADSNLNHYEFNKADEQFDAERLHDMIAKLPATTKQVFNLYVIDGFKHHEIAEKLNLNTGTSKWHLNRARKRLKEMLLKANEFENVIHYGK